MVKPYETSFYLDANQNNPSIFNLLIIIQKAMQMASIDHAEVIGYGKKQMDDNHAFWAIARLRVQVLLPLQNHHQYRMITWPNPYDFAGIDRNYQVYNQANELIIQGVGKWIIIDKEKYNLIKPNQFVLTKNSQSAPSEKVFSDGYIRVNQIDKNIGSYRYVRHVKPDEIDDNGHVNNVEYLRYIEEALKQNDNVQSQINEYQINYSLSLFEKDIINIQVTSINQNTQIIAKRFRDNQTIFSAVIL